MLDLRMASRCSTASLVSLRRAPRTQFKQGKQLPPPSYRCAIQIAEIAKLATQRSFALVHFIYPHAGGTSRRLVMARMGVQRSPRSQVRRTQRWPGRDNSLSPLLIRHPLLFIDGWSASGDLSERTSRRTHTQEHRGPSQEGVRQSSRREVSGTASAVLRRAVSSSGCHSRGQK